MNVICWLRSRKLNHYYKTIFNSIPESYTNKRIVIQTIQREINNYLIEFPESSFEEIQKKFGTPSEVAASFLNELSDTDIPIYFYKKKRIIHIICFVCLIFGIITAFLIRHIQYIRNYTLYTIEDTVYIHDRDTITE